MTDTPAPNRHRRWIVPILAAAGVLAAAVVAVLARGRQARSGPVGSLPPASPGVVSVGYVGSRWRLTAVTDGRGTTEIPASINAWLELADGGEFTAFDGVNTITGHFTVTRAGFDVSFGFTTLVGFGGTDRASTAAVTGMRAMTIDWQALPSVASSPPQDQPVHVTVLSADWEHLTVQAGGMRLTFVRTGPARTPGTPVPPAN